MDKKREYNTEQKNRLIDFLQSNRGKELSASDIAVSLSGIGRSTVYRLLGRLCSDGIVTKFIHDSDRKAVYQLSCCNGCEPHIHMKCTSCGRLVHLDSDTSRLLQSEVLSHYGFDTDEKSTILFGCCADCGNKESKESKE